MSTGHFSSQSGKATFLWLHSCCPINDHNTYPAKFHLLNNSAVPLPAPRHDGTVALTVADAGGSRGSARLEKKKKSRSFLVPPFLCCGSCGVDRWWLKLISSDRSHTLWPTSHTHTHTDTCANTPETHSPLISSQEVCVCLCIGCILWGHSLEILVLTSCVSVLLQRQVTGWCVCMFLLLYVHFLCFFLTYAVSYFVFMLKC